MIWQDRISQICGYVIGVFGSYGLSSWLSSYCTSPLSITIIQASLYLLYPMLIDKLLKGTPRFQDKVGPSPNYPVIVFNLIVVQYIMACISWPTFDFKSSCNIVEYIRDVAGLTLGYDISFYILHRIFHTPFLYKWIHKYHHRYKAPIAISAVDTHPIEHITVNLGSFYIASYVIHPHFISAFAFAIMAHLSTMSSHSGYKYLTQRDHDDHHRLTRYNYGLYFMDRLLGTTPPIQN